MSYSFVKDGQVYHTDNLSQFCREHDLRRTHIADVVGGRRRSHRGWSKPTTGDGTEGSEEGMTVEEVLKAAEIAAAASRDAEYIKLVQGRVDQIRRGVPLEVVLSKEEYREYKRVTPN
jgi:hypothetical protein